MIKIQQKGYFHSIAQFHIFQNKVLGNGSFGTVTLATHIKTCKLYAIKILNLKKIEDQPQLQIIENQIKIHMKLDHPHIVKLWDCLLQSNRLYMVMELVEKGSLFHWQNRCARFSQVQAFKYFYQTLQALKYLHSRKIIHRDIKPQNLLLDSNLNLKLCDLGWATTYISTKRTTFCGTYEYMAPQIVFQKQYDQKIDIWALGVLLYEMLHGYAPFRGDLLTDVKNKMKIGAYNIMGTVSRECKELIICILKFQAAQRITLAEIQQHEWTHNMQKHLLSNFQQNEYYNNTINLNLNLNPHFNPNLNHNLNHNHNLNLNLNQNPNIIQNYGNLTNSRKNSKNVHYRNQTQFSSNPFVNVCGDFGGFEKGTEKLLPYKELCTVSTKNTISSAKKGLFSSTYLLQTEQKPKDSTSKPKKHPNPQKRSTPEMTLLLHAKNSTSEQHLFQNQHTKRKNEFLEQRTKNVNKRCKTVTGADVSYKVGVHSKKKKEREGEGKREREAKRNLTPSQWKRKSQGNAVITGEFSIYVRDHKFNSKSKSKSRSKDKDKDHKERQKQKSKSKSKQKSKQQISRIGKTSLTLKTIPKNSSQPCLTPFSKKKI